MNKTFKIITMHLLVIIFIFSLPIYLGAQGTNTQITGSIQNPFNCGGTPNCTIIDLITAILRNIIMPIAAVAVTFWIIWAGFGFLTAQGNPAKLAVAKERLLWALIGAGILLGAVGISAVVQATVRALLVP